mgnify:CR=1 FL=1
MRIEELQERLRVTHERIGGIGRFSFTINQGADSAECYITHWFKPTPYAFTDCRTVGSGTVAECLEALDQYSPPAPAWVTVPVYRETSNNKGTDHV